MVESGLLGLLSSPHSGCESCLDSVTAHVEAAAANTKAITDYIDAAIEHIVHVATYIEAVIAHTEAAMTHTVPAKACVAPVTVPAVAFTAHEEVAIGCITTELPIEAQ